MLNPLRFFLTALAVALVSFTIAPSLFAAPQDGTAKPKADLKPGDIKKIQTPFAKAMDDPSSANIGKLADFLEKWDKKQKFGSPLSDVEAWEEIFANYRVKKAPKRVKGAGRISTGKGWFRKQGDIYEYEYAYRIPRAYKASKPLPTVLCIPDSGSKAKTYLKDVWCTGKENTALADQLVLVAAQIPKKVEGRKITEGRYKGSQSTDHTFEWFDYQQVFFMVRPLKDVQKLTNCDPSRVFVEGSGDGAALALHLASIYGIETFAGAVARNGSADPDHLNVVNGLGNVSLMLAQRKPHAKEKGGDARWKRWEDFKTLVEGKKWERVSIEESDTAPESLDRRTLAGQDVEPFVSANTKIAAFYQEQTAIAFPEKFRITSDNKYFTGGAGVKILEIADGEMIDVEVTLDRDANAVRLKGEHFSKVSLFLNDRVLDLDRPVEVFVNDVLWERKRVTRSLTAMLKKMRKGPYSGHRLVTAVLVVKEIVETEPAESENEEK